MTRQEYFDNLQDDLDDEFPKGDPARGRAIVLVAKAMIYFEKYLREVEKGTQNK